MRKYGFVLALMLVGLLSWNVMAEAQNASKEEVDPAKRCYPKGVSSDRLELVKTNYLESLRSENAGVVESAIFYVVKFKLFYSEQDMKAIRSELDRLATGGDTPAIRYKAQLAGNFLSYPNWLKKIKKLDYRNGDDFFSMLSTELQSRIFAVERGN